RLAIDALENPREQMARRDEQGARRASRCLRGSRQFIEQISDITGDQIIRREKTEIGVLLTRSRVVVARSDVHITPLSPPRAPHEGRGLAVILEADDAAPDVSAGVLERLSPSDVDLFVETSLELD